jgi:hypothetical protein
LEGKFTITAAPLPSQPQKDWNDEFDDIDDTMAHQELLQLQQFLGLVAPKDGKLVEDVVFVCIDCEAFESDHDKITEIGMLRIPSRTWRQKLIVQVYLFSTPAWSRMSTLE